MLKIQPLCVHAGQSKGVDLWQMETIMGQYRVSSRTARVVLRQRNLASNKQTNKQTSREREREREREHTPGRKRAQYYLGK